MPSRDPVWDAARGIEDFYEKKVQKLMVANVDLLSNMHNTLSVDTNQLIMGNIMD